MDLTKIKKVCSLCGKEKTLDKLFRCADCRQVFCDEHAAYPHGALCESCLAKNPDLSEEQEEVLRKLDEGEMVKEYKIDDKVLFTDNLSGLYGKQGTIVEVEDVKGLSFKLYTIQFEDGTKMPSCASGEFKKI